MQLNAADTFDTPCLTFVYLQSRLKYQPPSNTPLTIPKIFTNRFRTQRILFSQRQIIDRFF